ncbi:universal stress protein [Marinomonas sp. 15G1-11]|uniref:Universal stress protein n=1 Tax=Marinomonas phaeophyticola TaxID=3004091 RepID=A0ABT4JXT4_9GAMM|nr:universal stress protein [Marinomonas sp. 15G1-11]MCZ2723203.1 universal stress protein [Marinomonas sp. 15G1-11]
MLAKINTIIYACDLEGKTQEAMSFVMSMALQNQAKVILVHALNPTSPQTEGMIQNYLPAETLQRIREEFISTTSEKMHAQINAFLEENSEELKDLKHKPEYVVAAGAPHEAIQNTAKGYKADIIVMNSRTHSKLGQMMLGSTANKVIHQSHIPVLVVPIR